MIPYTEAYKDVTASFSPTHKVYNQIKEYAATLSPPFQLDITTGSIPLAVIISFFSKLVCC